MADSPTVEKTLYVHIEDHIVRTGILLYLDPLLLSDMWTRSLSSLSAVVTTLPATDPTTHTLPNGINAAVKNLTVDAGSGTVYLPEIPDTPGMPTAQVISSSSIRIDWIDNSTNEVAFHIERSTDQYGVESAFAEIGTTGSDVTTYLDNTGLADGTTYYYRVRASNAGGSSIYSPTINATTKDIYNLVPYGLLVSSPVLGNPIYNLPAGFTANNLRTGSPILGNPVFTKSGQLTANNLRTGNPILGNPTVTSASAATGSTWYVSPTGGSLAQGTSADPWDLPVAFSNAGYPGSSIQPGDTVIMKSGSYGSGGSTVFITALNGTSASPITFKPESGGYVRINGSVRFNSKWITMIGTPGILEIYNDTWDGIGGGRHYNNTTGPATVLDGVKYQTSASYCYIRNAFIHDVRVGISNQSEGMGGGAYGCVLYNCGWEDNNGGKSHGIYAQNHSSGSGSKTYEEIISGHHFELAAQLYGDTGYIDNHTFTGLVTINSNIWLAGWGKIGNTTFNQCTFRTNSYSPIGDRSIDRSGSIIISNSKFHAKTNSASIFVGDASGGSIINNQFVNTIGTGVVFYGEFGANAFPYWWVHNNYYGNGADGTFRLYDVSTEEGVPNTSYSAKTFTTWKSSTGYDSGAGGDASSYTSGCPATNQIEVRANAYETGRAHIIVHNWTTASAVAVNLDSVLTAGNTYEIRYALDPFNTTTSSAPLTGTFSGGSVVIPMSGWDYARPIGASDAQRSGWDTDNWGAQAASPLPLFGVFILRKTN